MVLRWRFFNRVSRRGRDRSSDPASSFASDVTHRACAAPPDRQTHLSTMEEYGNKGHGRMTSIESDRDIMARSKAPPGPVTTAHPSRRKGSIQFPQPRLPLTPTASTMPQIISNTLPPSAPASPPTPAPSPTPNDRGLTSWRLTPLEDAEDPLLEDARQTFARLNLPAKQDFLRSLVDVCDNHTLSFLHHLVSPRLKKDPFKALPNELCFRVRQVPT